MNNRITIKRPTTFDENIKLVGLLNKIHNVIVRIKPTRLKPMKLLVGFANIHVHKNTNYRLTFLSRSMALPNVHATTINNWNMVAGRLDINAWDKLSGFL